MDQKIIISSYEALSTKSGPYSLLVRTPTSTYQEQS